MLEFINMRRSGAVLTDYLHGLRLDGSVHRLARFGARSLVVCSGLCVGLLPLRVDALQSSDLREATTLSGWQVVRCDPETSLATVTVRQDVSGLVSVSGEARLASVTLEADCALPAGVEVAVIVGGRGRIRLRHAETPLVDTDFPRWPERFVAATSILALTPMTRLQVTVSPINGAAQFSVSVSTIETAARSMLLSGRARILSTPLLLSAGQEVRQGFPGLRLAGSVDVQRVDGRSVDTVASAKSMEELARLLQVAGVYVLSTPIDGARFQQSIVVGDTNAVWEKLRDRINAADVAGKYQLEMNRIANILKGDNVSKADGASDMELAERMAGIWLELHRSRELSEFCFPVLRTEKNAAGEMFEYMVWPRNSIADFERVLVVMPAVRDSQTGIVNSFTLRYCDVFLSTLAAARKNNCAVVWSNMADRNFTEASLAKSLRLISHIQSYRLPRSKVPKVIALGFCAGGTEALMLASRHPGLIHGAIAFAPSNVWWGAYSDHSIDRRHLLVNWIGNLHSTPVAIFHGALDHHVPVENTRELVSRGGPMLSYIEESGATESYAARPLGEVLDEMIGGVLSRMPDEPRTDGEYFVGAGCALTLHGVRLEGNPNDATNLKIERSAGHLRIVGDKQGVGLITVDPGIWSSIDYRVSTAPQLSGNE